MKKTLYLALLAACMLATPAATAAQQFASHEEASKSVTNDGYILISYAKGWDRFSEPLCKKVIAAPEVVEACENAALVLAPIYQYATNEEKEKQSSVWGALAVPRANSMNTYPCILMYDKEGYLYGRVQGEVLLRGTMKDIAAEIKTKLANKRKQEEIMAKADAASGVEKAKLIAEACAFTDIERPDGYLDMVKAADPGDQSGMIKRLTFYPWGIADKNFGEKAEPLETESFLRQMEESAKNPIYTPEQQQFFYAQCIAQLRRKGGEAARIKRYAAEMKKLAPESHLGVSADQAVKIWASGDSKK